MMSIINKQVPSKPDDSGALEREFELLWKCCMECWSYEPADRPTMVGVREHIELKVSQHEIVLIGCCTEGDHDMVWDV